MIAARDLSRFLVVLALGAAACGGGSGDSGGPPPDGGGAVSFAQDVQPIFNANCTACHKGASAPAELQLDTAGGVLRGSSSGKVIVPGNAKQSVLAQRVTDQTGITAVNRTVATGRNGWQPSVLSVDNGCIRRGGS